MSQLKTTPVLSILIQRSDNEGGEIVSVLLCNFRRYTGCKKKRWQLKFTFIVNSPGCVRAPVVPTTSRAITAKVDLDISQNVKGKNGDNSCWRVATFNI